MKTILFILIALGFSSCHVERQGRVDLRSVLYENYRQTEPGRTQGVTVTKFAHIGEIEADDRMYYVVDLRTVIEGMMSPRGNNYIALFDADGRLAETIRYTLAFPLWCQGSRVYLWGAEGQEGAFGNAWDFEDGIENGKRKLIEIPAYGSWRSEETLEK